jgi:hypothetical protein
MATTTNFGWETPDDTDLVKDGAAAIRTALGGVDTSFVDLKGGTTGQVLAKASATDLDFSWVAQDDSNAIQNAIVDAKGDLIAASAADTPARLAVGTNGQVLTADSAEATGLKWATPGGGALIYVGGSTFTGSSAVNINDVFSATYENYLIIFAGKKPSGTASGSGWRLRVGGVDNTSSVYDTQRFFALGGSTSSDRFNSTSWDAFDISTEPTTYAMNIYRPFATEKTTFYSYGFIPDGTSAKIQTNSGNVSVTTSYTGITFFPSSNTYTGTIRVYGLVNS